MHLLSLIRNSDLRFTTVEVLGQAKRNKFRGPFVREKQIKTNFHLHFLSLIRNFAESYKGNIYFYGTK